MEIIFSLFWSLLSIPFSLSVGNIIALLVIAAGVGAVYFGFKGAGKAWNALIARITPKKAADFVEGLSAERIDAFLDKAFANHRAPLLRGDRLAYAQSQWPESRWPTVYMDIPDDVRRPVVWDGRLLGGWDVTWLGWRHITADVVGSYAKAAGKLGVRAGAIMALITALFVVTGSLMYQSAFPYPEWASGHTVWPIVGWVVLSALDLVLAAATGLLFAVLAGLLFAPAAAYFAFWRGIKEWWNQATANLRRPTRDSLVIYKHKADIRATEYAAYARQAKDAATRLAEQPIIKVGTATGVLRARGDMEAPSRGQVVAFDGESIRQHTLILGGTGAGKTRLVVRPLFSRIMSANWGAHHKIGAYVTDGKGTLWQDLINSPAIADRDDVVVVGTEEGHKGVNLLAGMTPLEVSTTLKAVSGQVMGAPSDDFWPESASLLVLHAATIAQVLDMDPELDSNSEWQDARPWSLVGIGRLATDGRASKAAIDRLTELRGRRNELSPELVEALYSEELLSSVIWFNGTWAAMAGETKGGIIANVNVVLGKLAGAGELRRRFATGRYDDTVDVSHALKGGVLMVAVGETSWGMVGKVVSVWLKTRLYIEARKLLETDRASRANISCALFADEWQMLATVGPDSDASFWNIARETGVFLVAATQSLAALKQVLGDDAMSNLINLLRTKIVLKTEEISTLEYVTKLAGESLRGIVIDEGFFESQGQREIEAPDLGADPNPPSGLSFSKILPTKPALETHAMENAVRLDKRFLLRAGSKLLQGRDEKQIASEQAAFWRQEDKEREARGGNLQWRPKISSDELLLGSGMAFAIVQRAGGDRSDIIDLVEE